jgi:oligoendopeptidase F
MSSAAFSPTTTLPTNTFRFLNEEEFEQRKQAFNARFLALAGLKKTILETLDTQERVASMQAAFTCVVSRTECIVASFH